MEKKIILERDNKLIYVEGDRCYKVFLNGYNKADILNEALNHARVEETELRIPTLIGMSTINGDWSLITQYIEGKTFEELFAEDPANEEKYLERFVDIQLKMQSMRCPLLSKHRDKMNRKISQTDLSATLRYDLHTRIEAMPRHNCLCHGDYNPTNVVVDANGDAYILDWSHATQGNAEADCARTFLLFLLADQRDRASRYLKIFCDKSGSDYREVLAWLPILAASQSVKGFKDESAFLHSLIFMDEDELEELYERQ